LIDNGVESELFEDGSEDMFFGLLHLDVEHHKGAGQDVLDGAERGLLWEGFSVDFSKSYLFDLENFPVEHTLDVNGSLKTFKIVFLVLFCDSL
jgi:hypothetical protein